MKRLPPLEAVSAIERGEEEIGITGEITHELMTKICLAIGKSVTLKSLLCDSECRVGPEGAKAIAKAIEMSKTMTTLDLSGNNIGDEGAKAIAKAIEVSKTMTTLNLSQNDIEPSGAEAIGRAIEKSKTMTTLSLAFTDVGLEGAKAIGKALEVSETMLSLNLLWANIKPDGAVAIGKGIERSKTMTTLDLRTNNIGEEGAEAIGKGIETSKTMTKLYLSNNNFGFRSANTFGENGERLLAESAARRNTRGLSFRTDAVDDLESRRVDVEGLGPSFTALLQSALERRYLDRLIETHAKVPQELRTNADLRSALGSYLL